jgi:multiple sugar transport system permease protein
MRSARYQVGLTWMLLPFLVGVSLLVILPAVLSFGLALTDYNGVRSPRWIGIAGYRAVISDSLFQTAALNTLLYTLYTVPLRTLLTLGLALLLAAPRRGAGLYRAAIYLPTVVPGVAYALVWLWIFNPRYGPLNLALQALGLPTPAWLVEPQLALPALAFSALFQLGEGFIVLLAGLNEIPRDYYENAELDGAGRLQTFRWVVLPLLMPWLVLIVVRDVIVAAQHSFTPTLVMTGGGPYYATLTLPLLIYRTAFDQLQFGAAAAMTMLLFVATAALIWFGRRWTGGWGYDDAV